ncbi:AAA ATPase domain-containing protein [Paenibacillus sp. CF095]|uniref:AAA family ATPase n=1 Tax=Paenibacillus sp. CF095 TaxID=1881033 RepID=UPI00088FDCB1|nr:AAA family ATPase [Paenibacillus sp. CF095]SDD55351.1 AAA ATPase domain-containing protein [Paenibacillus sp. CF095]
MDNLQKISDLEPGMVIDEYKLTDLFKCSRQGGMRRSLKTNSLVLLSYKGKPPYTDIFKDENGLWQYTGMGRIGDQNLQYSQNKTLLNSNETGVKLYLFNVDNGRYKFEGRVLLAGSPKKESQLDEKEEYRSVYVFPLLEIGSHMNAYDFFMEQSREDLVIQGVLGEPRYELSLHSVQALTQYMKSNNLNTLSGPGGWFYNVKGFFNNPNTTSKFKIGNIKNLIEETNNKKISRIVFENQNKYINPFYDTVIQRPNRLKASEKDESGFLVHSLNYVNSINIQNSFNVSFFENHSLRESSEPYITLIIGPNGTGKSTILSTLQKIFLALYRLKKSKKKTTTKAKNSFNLTYQIGVNLFEVIQKDNIQDYFKNGEHIHLSELELPNKLIASAYSINDRFTYQNQFDGKQNGYSYLGIKSSDNTIRIGETSRNLILNILNSSQKNHFEPILEKILKFVKLEPAIRIVFKTPNNETLEEVAVRENLLLKQNKMRKSKTKSELDSIHFSDYQDILDFFERLNTEPNNIFKKNKDSIFVTFKLNEPGYFERYYDDLYILWHLFEIDIFKEPTVYIRKEKYFKLELASSGEVQYITTMINILSNIERDSLILMDEPETSLHPNWQNKYIEGLRDIFSLHYASAHFLLATHSHFMVSDLKPNTSSIVSIERDSLYQTQVILHKEETFGWSVEDVLYNIFDLATDRNYYLADELDQIMLAISTNNRNGLAARINRIEQISTNLKESDPLKTVIRLISQKIKGE